MSHPNRKSARGNRRRAGARHRWLARLLAINFVLFASPLLPGWLTLASPQSGTQFVQLCTSKGLRLVAVPAEEALPVQDSAGGERTGFDCAACPLHKCASAGLGPAPFSRIALATASIDDGPAIAEPPPATVRITLRPPTRAPPSV